MANAKPSPGKISQKNLMPGQITAKNLMTRQVFITFRVPKLKFFGSFIKYYTFFCQKLLNAWAKFTSQDLMPGHKLTPEN